MPGDPLTGIYRKYNRRLPTFCLVSAGRTVSEPGLRPSPVSRSRERLCSHQCDGLFVYRSCYGFSKSVSGQLIIAFCAVVTAHTSNPAAERLPVNQAPLGPPNYIGCLESSLCVGGVRLRSGLRK